MTPAMPMPEWLTNLGFIEWAGLLGALTVISGFFWKIGRGLIALIAAGIKALKAWNGVEEEKDASGIITVKGIPSVPGQLALLTKALNAQAKGIEAQAADLLLVKKQVQNSHNTNFRDDLDKNTALSKEALMLIAALASKLDQHIGISKKYDADQVESDQLLKKHIADTERWTPMLEALHQQYVGKQRYPPESTE